MSSVSSSVTVAVRVRPLNEREHNTQIITRVVDNKIIIDTDEKKTFEFNYAYDHNTKQEQLYRDIGSQIIQNAHTGYNSCIFAYGQTGCFAASTPIMLFNGKYKFASEITKQDLIMGDDGSPRKVLALFKGQQQMYDVIDADSGKMQYCVNLDHTLLLKRFRKELSDEFINNLHLNANTAYFDLLYDDIIEMTIKDYLALPDEEKHRLVCYETDVNFKNYVLQDVIDKINNGEVAIKDKYLCNNIKLAKYIKSFLHATNDEQKWFLETVRFADYPTNEQMDDLTYIANCIAATFNITTELWNSTLTEVVSDDLEANISLYKLCLLPKKMYFRPKLVLSKETEYYGFMLNKNHRFIGAGFHVLRNSGKTYSMMGGAQQEMGLIPRICYMLFNSHKPSITYRVELSYLEIYSEKVYDLLNPNSERSDDKLRVRFSPNYGPFVENLSQHVVDNFAIINKFIERGNKERRVAATLMNDRSSRSHAILTLYFTQIIKEDTIPAIQREIVSKINLVDLAGSERISDSGVTGVNRDEAVHINKSLSTLSMVIHELAKKSRKPNNNVIPYRNSILTTILMESLGGNSKTVMIATVSPSIINCNETIGTLRYASNAKGIVNSVYINQTSNESIIQSLKKEIELLKAKLKSGISNKEIIDTKAQLDDYEALIKQREKSWEEKEIESHRQLALYKKELETKNSEIEKVNLTLHLIKQEADQRLKERELKHEQDKNDFEKTRIVTAIKESHEFVSQQVETKIRDTTQKYEELQKKYITLEHLYNDKCEENVILGEKLAQANSAHISYEATTKNQIKQLTNDKNMLSRQVQQLQSKIYMLEHSDERD